MNHPVCDRRAKRGVYVYKWDQGCEFCIWFVSRIGENREGGSGGVGIYIYKAKKLKNLLCQVGLKEVNTTK